MSKIKIGGHIYEITEVDDAFREGTYGTIVYNTNQIIVSSNLVESQKEETLLHEFLHAINTQYKIGLNDSQIERLAEGLYALYIDNFKDFCFFSLRSQGGE